MKVNVLETRRYKYIEIDTENQSQRASQRTLETNATRSTDCQRDRRNYRKRLYRKAFPTWSSLNARTRKNITQRLWHYKNRGHTFRLSERKFFQLLTSECEYCRYTPNVLVGDCNTIDRINNNKDYVPNNVQTLCEVCQSHKSNRGDQETREHFLRVAENLKRKEKQNKRRLN